MADMIEIKHLNKYFGDLHVLKDINLTVKRGEKLVMIGPSGSGKSTLIRCVDYLEEPTSGEVVIDGTPLTKKNHLEMARKYSSMVFQQFNLYPNMTVLGNLTLAPIKLQKKSKEEATEIAIAALKRVGMRIRPASIRRTSRAVSSSASPSPVPCAPSSPSSCLTSRPRRSTPRWSRRFWTL